MLIKNKKLYIFDLDGTLVDAYSAIEDSLNYARSKFGFSKVDYLDVKGKVGRGDKIFVETFFPKDNAKDALEIYRQHHKKSLVNFTKPMHGLVDLLSGLKKLGKIVTIASNRPSEYTKIILDALEISKYFDYVLCGDQVERMKPDPMILDVTIKKFGMTKQDAVFVGDMDIDMQTAQEACVDAIFIEGGSSTKEEVAKYKNKIIVSSLNQILNV